MTAPIPFPCVSNPITDRPNGRSVERTSSGTSVPAPVHSGPNTEADLLFEARLQWFLAVSRAA